MDTRGVKALVFDVFGTIVDWRGSVVDQFCVFVGCPRIVYTDVDTSCCKAIEKSQLARLVALSRT